MDGIAGILARHEATLSPFPDVAIELTPRPTPVQAPVRIAPRAAELAGVAPLLPKTRSRPVSVQKSLDHFGQEGSEQLIGYHRDSLARSAALKQLAAQKSAPEKVLQVIKFLALAAAGVLSSMPYCENNQIDCVLASGRAATACMAVVGIIGLVLRLSSMHGAGSLHRVQSERFALLGQELDQALFKSPPTDTQAAAFIARISTEFTALARSSPHIPAALLKKALDEVGIAADAYV